MSKRVNKLRKIHFSSSGDILCTSIIEIIEIFSERLGSYWKFRLKMGGGGTYLWGGRFLDSSVGALLKLPQQ